MKSMKKQSKTISATDVTTLSCDKIMDVLEPGDVYSYKEICSLLEQTAYRNKNQRNAQLKTFKRFFDFDIDEDNDLIITDVYTEIQPKLPRKARSDSYYSQNIQYLLLNIFNERQDNCIIMSSKQWWLYLGFMKDKYFEIKNIKDNKQDENEELNTAISYGKGDVYFIKEDMNNFYSRTGQKFYYIFYDALRALTDRSFINANQVYMVGKDWDDLHEANEDEQEICLTANRKALLETQAWCEENNIKNSKGYRVKISKLSQIIYQPEIVRKHFYALSDKYKRDLGGWNIAYKATKIIYSKYGIKAAIEQDKKKIEHQKIKEKLNYNIVTQLNKQLLKDNDIIWDLDEFYTDDILENEKIKDNKDVYKQLLLTERLIDITK